jgi:hypothetical protein
MIDQRIAATEGGLFGRSLARMGRLWKGQSEAAGLAPTCIILSSRHRLWQRYGPDGVFAIERAVEDLQSAMSTHGLTGTLVYADDSPLLGRYGVLPAEIGKPNSVARMLRELAERLSWTEESVQSVLILGDDGILPFDRPQNPAPDDEDDLRSDLIYAADPDEPLMPVRAVGRMPDTSLDLLIGSIRGAAAAHRRLASDQPFRLSEDAFGYSASVWKRAARGVYAAIGQPAALRICPPLTRVDAPRPGSAGPRFRYYNLHGTVDSPAWFGQRDPAFRADYERFPVAIRPEDLDPAPGGLVFSAACFGAHLEGRAIHDSMALSSLAGGVNAFIGATGVAYGGLDGTLVAADLMAYRFWEAVRAGAPVGQALAHAKCCLISETLARQGYLDAEDEKAVHNFVLYGDPSLVYHAPSSWAEDAAVAKRATDTVGWAGPASRVGTSPARPHSIHYVGAPSRDPASTGSLVTQVQRAVARVLPEFGAGEVGVTTTPAPRRVHAKSGLVEADPSKGPMIVRLRKSLLTADGGQCRETVCVTVDAGGSIRKLTVSK